jgi:formylglycine-generating enzyme required for sulfatase activity
VTPQATELVERIVEAHHLDAEHAARVAAIFEASSRIGQGNPAVTLHPMSRETCAERRAGIAPDPAFEAICGGPNLAPLYDPATQRPEEARACIDQYEFPDVPCEYPVVWVRASEAAELCEAVGERLCDAHEWEGACAGALLPPDYDFRLAVGLSASAAAAKLRSAHNAQYADPASRVWSYGPAYREGVCATGSAKSAGCDGADWATCGSNTYPAGAFPECRSPLGVYDLNGNAAEHMNLPLAADQMASAGSTTLGVTEMKGSWFVFDEVRAHDDWCRWRAPYWHGSKVMDPDSHRNYHLGFRCCVDR